MNICDVASVPTRGAVDVCGFTSAAKLGCRTQYVIIAFANTWHAKYCFLNRTPTVRWNSVTARKHSAVTIMALVQCAASIVVG